MSLLTPATATAQPRTPVLVELFTSEGCSSCPAAEDLLTRLLQTQPVGGAEIIALAEHVDYFNYLGWDDPYSSPQFSQRQRQYATSDQIYTPQMVVDGHSGFVGSNAQQAVASIQQAARTNKLEVRLGSPTIDGSHVSLPVEAPSRSDIKMFAAVAEDAIISHVLHGENGGRTLAHSAVVRRLLALGGARPTTAQIEMQPAWNRAHLRVVVFLQDRDRHIVGVGERHL